jgi:hypothetical protein
MAQGSKKAEVASDEETLRRDERAEALRDASAMPPTSVPIAIPPADHRRLEGEDELRRSGIRIEGSAHAKKAPATATVANAMLRRSRYVPR